MATQELAFSTFLKLLEFDDALRQSTLRQFLVGDGFDYWSRLRGLAPGVVSGTLDERAINAELRSMKEGHRRENTEEALVKLRKWSSSYHAEVQPSPARVIAGIGDPGLSVRLQPEVAFRIGGRLFMLHLWATHHPVLSRETLSMGLYFFRGNYEVTDAQFVVFDAVGGRSFEEKEIVGGAAQMLEREERRLATSWAEVCREAATPKGEFGRPISRRGESSGLRPSQRQS